MELLHFACRRQRKV